MLSPEDNNERQPIHDHESIDLKALAAASLTARETVKAKRLAPDKLPGCSPACGGRN